jgi:hypothetical protein
MAMQRQQDRIYAAYSQSPQIRLAVETWQNSVLASGFDVTTPVATDQVRYLIGDILRQLVLIGFAVILDGVVDPQSTITWDSSEKAWRADADEDADVTVCIFSPPARLRDDMILTSYGAAAVPVWEKLSHLEQNMMLRDSLNSVRSVYTTVDPNVTVGNSLTPSFVAARSNPNAAADADYTTSIRRHELLRELAKHTESARGDDLGSQLVAGGGFPIDARVKHHDELFVTDGMSMGAEARHLSGPVSDFNRLLRTLDHDLLMAAGVPPQKLGMNVNSERLAGSELISSQALDNFNARVREIRATVNESLLPLGVVIRPTVPYPVLVQHANLFEPSKHRELLADSLGIPHDYLTADPMEVAGEPGTGINDNSAAAKHDVGADIV